jgi:8-oxo-dGTP pyrophosphatase MutT (NUDIX family)
LKPRGGCCSAPAKLEPGDMLNRLVRLAATAAHRLLAVSWFFRRPKTYGAHAIALTRDKRVVLVKLRYAPGWRVPGGGVEHGEPAIEAALRELREEIGMTGHGSAELACDLDENVDFRRDTCSLVIVRDVEYQPKGWNWELERVYEAPLDDLPADLSPQTARWLRTVAPLL